MATGITHSSVYRRDAHAVDLLYILTVLLTTLLPFELIRPIVSLPGFVVTNLELLLIMTALVWLAQAALTAAEQLRLRHSPLAANWRLLLPVLFFLIVALVSALAAAANRLDGLKFVTRLASGAYAFFLFVHIARTRQRLAGLLWALILGAGVSALLGVLEAWNGHALSVLNLFKAAPTLVGGELRVSATFQYATITAMFFEMSIPVALGLAASAGRTTMRLIAMVLAGICTVVVALTLTRAGIVTLGFVLVTMLALAWLSPRWRVLARPTLLALLVLLTTLAILSLSTWEFRTRLMTENDANWYGAEYRAPAELTVRAGELISATIQVHNTGQATWQSLGDHPYALAARWLTWDDGQELRIARAEIVLSRDVSPGESMQIMLPVQAMLPPGTYRLSWGMLQQDILWFRHRNAPEAETVVQVLPGAVLPPAPSIVPADDLSSVPPTLGRIKLWQAALLMVRERPLLGVGPDNFRHLHGRYLGLTIWNTSIHANNLYLELLADLGVTGLLAFAWVVSTVVMGLYKSIRTAPGDAIAVWAICLAGSLLAFLVHGLLDYFLGFTGLYLLFWMTLGLMVAAARLLAGQNRSAADHT